MVGKLYLENQFSINPDIWQNLYHKGGKCVKRLQRICCFFLVIVLVISIISGTLLRPRAAAYSEGVQNIVKRARQMTQIQWIPQKDIVGWDWGVIYRAGVTYAGLPYGQPLDGDYVPWEISLQGFLNAVNDPDSLMYTDYATGKRAPYYSIDCSAFVSWAWGLGHRVTTHNMANYAIAISSSSYANAQVGDCLNKASSHVVLITDIAYDASGNIVAIEISESTVNKATNYCCQVVRYGQGGTETLATFTSKYFGNGYTLYRSKTRDSVTYTHSCAVPLEGDICAECGLGGYVSLCTAYPCAVQLYITEDCCPYTQPCNPSTAAEEGKESQKLTNKPISKGETLTADALYQNTEGNYWYKVTLSDGTKAYLYSTHTKMNSMIKPWVAEGGFPSSISGTTYLQGTVTAGGARLDKVQAYVCEAGSYSPVIESELVTVKAATYPLRSSRVDNTLVFGDLKQFGNADYTLRIMTDFTTYYADDNKLATTGLCGYDAGSYDFRFVAETHSHSYTSVVTRQPICTQDGVRTYTCPCGASYTETIPATGHRYSGSRTEPTCSSAGEICYTCAYCGDSYTETIPSPGHTYYEQVSPPTCTEQGYTTHICSACGSSYRDSYTAPSGHSFEDGVCLECGAEDPDALIPGDLDGDGTVASADAVLLARYLVDLIELTETQRQAADVDHDGAITSSDAVLVARLLADLIPSL